MSETKLIKNIDNVVWLKFAGHCKANGVLIGKELTKVIKDYLRRQVDE